MVLLWFCELFKLLRLLYPLPLKTTLERLSQGYLRREDVRERIEEVLTRESK